VEPVLEAEAVPVPALSQEKLYMAVPLGMGVSDTFVMAAPTRTQIVRPGEGQTPDVSYLQQEGTNTRYPVTDTISFGRLPRNTIVIMDEQVSRRHAEIVLRHGAAILRDLQSANGTFVNGERISGERTLRDGDTVAIGDVKFVYHHVEKIGRAVLVAVGQGRGQEYPITSRVRIGREPTNDIVVRDPKASRRHAELFTQQGRVFLRDLDSLNGTHLNGQLVLGDQPLYDGDTVSIGDTAFVYHSDAPVPAAP
jgi:pSer/pThr/pTyr-binding forkhead associated (FHA) protein